MLRKLTWEAGIVFMKVKMQKKRQKRKWTRRTTNFVRKQSKTGARTGVNCTTPWSKIKISEEESMLNFADELEVFLERVRDTQRKAEQRRRATVVQQLMYQDSASPPRWGG